MKKVRTIITMLFLCIACLTMQKNVKAAFNTPYGEINVMDFGAVGDGIADDTDAIQSAIDSLETMNGGTIYFPVGVYKITDSIVLRSNTTLHLAGDLSGVNVKEGYTDAVKAMERAVILKGTARPSCGNANYNMFNNHVKNATITEGNSNITITGGMIDMNGSFLKEDGTYDKYHLVKYNEIGIDSPTNLPGMVSTNGFGFALASNITLRGVIFKDVFAGHVIQFSGVSNVLVDSCMFVGTTYAAESSSQADANSTKECIQIECFSPAGYPYVTVPRYVTGGEGVPCNNVAIRNCYFGDSDKCGPILTAVGTHSQNGAYNAEYVMISHNYVDDPYYSAFRFVGYRSTYIDSNTIVASGANFRQAGLIYVYGAGDASTTDDQGVSCKSPQSEQTGNEDLFIIGNTITINKGANKRAFYFKSRENKLGATVQTKKIDLNGTATDVTKYYINKNVVHNVQIQYNTINVPGLPKYKDNLCYFEDVAGLRFEENENYFNFGDGVREKYKNVIVKKNIKDETSYKERKITTSGTSLYFEVKEVDNPENKPVVSFRSDSDSQRTITFIPGSNGSIRVVNEGLDQATGVNKVIVEAVAEGPYVFAGWYTDSSFTTRYDAESSDVILGGDMTLYAKWTIR